MSIGGGYIEEWMQYDGEPIISEPTPKWMKGWRSLWDM